MSTFVNRLAIGIVIAVAAGAAAAQTLTDAEFKCQTRVSKAGAKFVAAKGKCAITCVTQAAKGLHPFEECTPPFAGAMAACVADAVTPNGAENEFAAAIRAACDPATHAGTDCPECYSGGNCSDSGEAGDRVQTIEEQLESVDAGIYCNTQHVTAAERTCELATGKRLARLTGAILKCYDKCHAAVRRGRVPESACVPPASDAKTTACVRVAETRAMAGIDRRCAAVGAIPDCFSVDDYPTSAWWVNLVSITVAGSVPGTYCDSPSGAFVE